MNLYVIDYDGTIKLCNDVNIKENLYGLSLLLNDNNIVMISTGRLFKSIKFEIDKYNIIFNYVSCANGNILFDSKFNNLFSTVASEKIIKELKPFYSSILGIELLDAYGNVSKKPVEYYVHIENNLVSRRKIVDMILSTSFLDYCSDADNKFNIHIFNAIDKISTIEFLRKKVKISDVYTVGDGPNDIGMLKKYNGFIIGDNLMKYEDLSDIPHFSSFDDFVKNVQYTYKKKRNL